MAMLPLKSFLGLRTGVSDPEPGSAKVALNFRRNRTRGQLELVDGLQTNLTFAPTIKDSVISAPVPVAFKSFYIADNGGRTVTAVLATYSLQGIGGAIVSPAVATAGIFLRPYYNGSAWIDEWQEVTECVVTKYASALANQITCTSLGTFANDYFAGWTLVWEGDFAQTAKATGFLVTNSTQATSKLTIAGDAGDVAAWTAPTDKLYLFRNVQGAILPSSITTNFRAMLDELRLNTGNAATDIDVALFYRDKTFWQGQAYARKGTFSEYGQLNLPAKTMKLATPTVTSVPAGGLPRGSYAFKMSMVTDDGQETELRDTNLGNFPETMALANSTSLGGGQTVLATNGTYIYAATYLWSGTYNYIYRIDALTNEIVSSIRIGTDTGSVPLTSLAGKPFAITCQGGNVYVMFRNSNDTFIRCAKFTEGLDTVLLGTWTPGIGAGIAAILNSYGCANATSFSTLVNCGGSGYRVSNYSLTTCEELLHQDGVGAAGQEYIACDDTYILTGGSTKCQKWTIASLNVTPPTDEWAALGGAALGAMVQDNHNVYVGQAGGTKIKKIVLASDAVSDFYTSGAVVWTGMATDGTYLYGKHDIWLRKIRLSDSVLMVSASDGVPDTSVHLAVAGTHIFGSGAAYSLMFTMMAGGATFTSDGYLIPGYKLLLSCGYTPRRGSLVRIYVSKDSGPYYQAKEHSILSGGVNFGAHTLDTLHRYYPSDAQTISAADYAAATVSALDNLGRDTADSGVRRYLYAIVANNRTYAIGVQVASRLQRNKVFLNAISGAGISQYDVLPNDVTTILDVEFNDGDYALALGNVADRVLVLKNRSRVMLTPLMDGSHQRDLVATGVGIAAINSLVKFNECLYWLDHSGVWQFSTNGLKKMSGAIDATLFAYQDTDRTGALGCVDPKNSQYRLQIGDTTYVCDLADGEWTTENAATGVWFDEDLGFGTQASTGVNARPTRRYAMLVGTAVQTPTENIFAGSSAWESSRVELPLERGYDGLLSAMYLDYDMQGTIPVVTLSVFLDESEVAAKVYTLPTGTYEVTVPAPLAATCKSFRLRVDATATSGQKLRVRRLGVYFNQIPMGGNQRIVYPRRADATVVWVHLLAYQKLIAVNVTDKTAPTQLSVTSITDTVNTDFPVRNIQVDANYLYYTHNAKFYIRNANPSNPAVVYGATPGTTGGPLGQLIRMGPKKFAVASFSNPSPSGVTLIDTTNPAAPVYHERMTGDAGYHLWLPSPGLIGAIDPNTLAYYSGMPGGGGWMRYYKSLLNGSTPGAWSQNDPWGVGNINGHHAAVVSGRYLYQLGIWGGNTGVIYILDLNGATPTLVGNFAPAAAGNNAAYFQMFKRGNYLIMYSPDTSSPSQPRFLVYDISVPLTPSLVQTVNTGPIPNSFTIYPAWCFSGRYMYFFYSKRAISISEVRLKIYDVNNPTAWIEVSDTQVYALGGSQNMDPYAAGCRYPGITEGGNIYLPDA